MRPVSILNVHFISENNSLIIQYSNTLSGALIWSNQIEPRNETRRKNSVP